MPVSRMHVCWHATRAGEHWRSGEALRMARTHVTEPGGLGQLDTAMWLAATNTRMAAVPRQCQVLDDMIQDVVVPYLRGALWRSTSVVMTWRDEFTQ